MLGQIALSSNEISLNSFDSLLMEKWTRYMKGEDLRNFASTCKKMRSLCLGPLNLLRLGRLIHETLSDSESEGGDASTDWKTHHAVSQGFEHKRFRVFTHGFVYLDLSEFPKEHIPVQILKLERLQTVKIAKDGKGEVPDWLLKHPTIKLITG